MINIHVRRQKEQESSNLLTCRCFLSHHNLCTQCCCAIRFSYFNLDFLRLFFTEWMTVPEATHGRWYLYGFVFICWDLYRWGTLLIDFIIESEENIISQQTVTAGLKLRFCHKIRFSLGYGYFDKKNSYNNIILICSDDISVKFWANHFCSHQVNLLSTLLW